MNITKNIKVFVDGPWDDDVRMYGAPMRIYLHTKHWVWLIGLLPNIKAQVWTGSEGYTDRFRWIVRHPKLKYHVPEFCKWDPRFYSDEEWVRIKEVLDRATPEPEGERKPHNNPGRGF